MPRYPGRNLWTPRILHVYSRRRNRRSATNGRSNPAPLFSMRRSALEQIGRTRTPSFQRVDGDAITYSRRRIRQIGDGAGTSTSVPPPLPLQFEDSNLLLSNSEEVAENSFMNLLSAASSGNEIGGEEEQISVQHPVADAPVMSSPEGDGSTSVPLILTDPTVLDCPICCDPLSAPLYQCANGHILCHSCAHKMRQMNAPCYGCRLHFGLYRCRALESVLKSTTASCCYGSQGCRARFTFDEKRAHEKECSYALYSCPHKSCSYFGKYKELYDHVSSHHSKFAKEFVLGSPVTICMKESKKFVWLQERKEKILFIIYNSVGPCGNEFTVVCVAPGSSTRVFSFDLSAGDGRSTVSLRSCADNSMEMLGEFLGPTYLKVPRCFATGSGVYKVELTIWSQPE